MSKSKYFPVRDVLQAILGDISNFDDEYGESDGGEGTGIK